MAKIKKIFHNKLYSKIFILIVLFVIAVLCLALPAEVWGGTCGPDTGEIYIKSGESVSFKIIAQNAVGRVDVSSSDTSVAVVSTDSVWVDNNYETITVTGVGDGWASIIVSLTDVTDYETLEAITGSYEIGVTVETVTQPPETIPETISETLPETVPETYEETIAETTAQITTTASATTQSVTTTKSVQTTTSAKETTSTITNSEETSASSADVSDTSKTNTGLYIGCGAALVAIIILIILIVVHVKGTKHSGDDDDDE